MEAIPSKWDWTVKAWTIGEESLGTRVVWADNACMYYDCLCVIALFCEVMLVVHDWAYLPAWTVTGIGYCRTNTWEVGCLGTIYPTCDVARFFGSD